MSFKHMLRFWLWALGGHAVKTTNRWFEKTIPKKISIEKNIYFEILEIKPIQAWCRVLLFNDDEWRRSH